MISTHDLEQIKKVLDSTKYHELKGKFSEYGVESVFKAGTKKDQLIEDALEAIKILSTNLKSEDPKEAEETIKLAKAQEEEDLEKQVAEKLKEDDNVDVEIPQEELKEDISHTVSKEDVEENPTEDLKEGEKIVIEKDAVIPDKKQVLISEKAESVSAESGPETIDERIAYLKSRLQNVKANLKMGLKAHREILLNRQDSLEAEIERLEKQR